MNQTYYLDRVVNNIVNETIIGGGKIFAPFLNSPHSISTFPRYLPSLPSFSEYVIKEYGLTEEESEYVWEQYWDIINNRPNYSKHP